mmetsp:Transcript_123292/g.343330  ORF Transcript_123292/g.343330 Transcript_123292/m.343330 type:complete len:227 (-) Transcript_123292:84-764(-)
MGRWPPQSGAMNSRLARVVPTDATAPTAPGDLEGRAPAAAPTHPKPPAALPRQRSQLARAPRPAGRAPPPAQAPTLARGRPAPAWGVPALVRPPLGQPPRVRPVQTSPATTPGTSGMTRGSAGARTSRGPSRRSFPSQSDWRLPAATRASVALAGSGCEPNLQLLGQRLPKPCAQPRWHPSRQPGWVGPGPRRPPRLLCNGALPDPRAARQATCRQPFPCTATPSA